jgi:hypothetical protein
VRRYRLVGPAPAIIITKEVCRTGGNMRGQTSEDLLTLYDTAALNARY